MAPPTPPHTLAGRGEAEITDRGSRFISWATRAETPEAAMALVDEARQRWPDASHHCFAYCLAGPPVAKRFSDDGEPSGSAGRPILTVLEHSFVDAAVVVTRFFGGTKLGVGGLVRAYTRGAQAAVSAAGLVPYEIRTRYILDYPYELSRPVQYHLDKLGLSPQTEFGERLRTQVQVPAGLEATWSELLQEWRLRGLTVIEPELP